MPRSVILGAAVALHQRQARQRNEEADRLVQAYCAATDAVLRLLTDDELDTLIDGIDTERAGQPTTAAHAAVRERVDALDAELHPDPTMRIEALHQRGVVLIGVGAFTRRANRYGKEHESDA